MCLGASEDWRTIVSALVEGLLMLCHPTCSLLHKVEGPCTPRRGFRVANTHR